MTGRQRPAPSGGRRAPTRTAVVVGAGVFGLCVARELAIRRWSVRVVDTRRPGDAGPSTAESRILRFSHGDDTWYPALARRARSLWQALERETGKRLLLPSGVLVFGPPPADGDCWEQASARQLSGLGIPVETMRGPAVRRRFPEFDGRDCATVLFEPHGGILLARQATRALAESALGHGAEIMLGAAQPCAGAAVAVDGQRLDADLTVWAVGPALPAVFPGLAAVREVRQDSWYLRPGGPWAATADQPAWLDRAHGYYGVPAVGVLGVKVVPDVESPDVESSPEPPASPPPDGLPNQIRDYLRTRLPDLATSSVLRRERCSYARTGDENFLLARYPGSQDRWIVGGDSGHGFKHGPAWGEYVCDVVEGRTAVPKRFALR
jgi:glycine/D-amino acid oxidase-like deaminating enzyme